QVTAFARNPSKVRVTHDNLRIVRGDVLDYASVEAAMKGQDAVLCALGHKRWFIPSSILSQGTGNIIQAMETHGVRRLVCETSLGISDSWWRLGLYYTLFVKWFILYFYFRDKEKQERLIKESGLEWIIIRPGALNNGRKRGVYRHGPRVGHWLWTVRISRADVADFMLNHLDSTEYLQSTPGVCW
ncbi:MAG: NAD(P)H-binding protein, partial [Ignavibacteria bacterium]|nr:NAD(P)H-binding protein [Ignavibacteria bacterium]